MRLKPQKFRLFTRARLRPDIAEAEFGQEITGTIKAFYPAEEEGESDMYFLEADQNTGEFGFTGEVFEEDLEEIEN
jgi:hypothetical protein